MSSPRFCSQCKAPLEHDLCPACTMKALAQIDGLTIDRTQNGPDIPEIVVHEEIGEGGFGIVYRATQTGTIRRPVALKVLKPGVDTRAVLRRFAVEQQALATLEHPYIARLYDAGETADGYPWFTMELIKGEPITDALAGESLDVILRIFLKVCEAVSFAHQKGILHRDLKPSNILVTANGTPKIIDFGVSKATNPQATPGMTLYTADELQIGTPAYMAPERGADVDARSEVYALGATLYELLTGITPPAHDQPRKKASLVALLPVPRRLDHILDKAMAPESRDRYQSVDDLAADLRSHLAGEAISTSPSIFRPWLWATATFLLALITWLSFRNPGDPPVEPLPPPPAVRHQASGHPHLIWINKNGTRALAVFRTDGPAILFDPNDGRKIFTFPAPPLGIGSGCFDEEGKRFIIGYSDGSFRWYSSHDGRILSPYIDCTPEQRVWVPDVRIITLPKAQEPVVLIATPDSKLRTWKEEGTLIWEVPLVAPPYGLRVSPDKRFAISGSANGKLNLIDLTQQKRRILTGHRAHIYGFHYSPNGEYFSCASYDHRCSIWRHDGTLLHMLRHEGKCQEALFSPDSTLLATASWDGTARLWEVESGKELHRLEHTGDILGLAFSPDGTTLATGGRNNEIRFWDVVTGTESAPPIPCGQAVAELAYHTRPDGGLNIIAITWEPALRIIPLTPGEE